MIRSKLLWQLYAGYVAVIIMTSFIIGTVVSRQVSESSLHEIEASLSAKTELLAEVAKPYLGKPTSDELAQALQNTLKRLDQNTHSRFTILSSRGIVLADSRELAQQMDNHLGRPEILDAQTHGAASITRYSQTLRQFMMYRAMRVDKGDQTIGFVRVSQTLSTIDAKLDQIHAYILIAAVSATMLAMLLGFYFARRFAAPLTKITELAQAISRGDRTKRITVIENNEIGSLATAINRMAETSAKRLDEITADRNRLAEIFAGMVEGVIGVDRQQNIIHINRGAARLLGLSMTASIRKPIWQEVRVQEITNALEQAMENQSVIRSQMRRFTNKEELVVDIYAAALGNDAGATNGAVIVLHDISELDNLERIRRDFVANASHELKTPITAIRALTETILDDTRMDSNTRQRFTEKIHVQSVRLSALVSDLMTLSRLDSGGSQDALQRYDLARIIRQSASSARSVCQDNGLELSLTLPNEHLWVLCDQQAMSQMMDNLIDNAIHYTPSGGKIDLQLVTQNEQAIITISDTGIGIGPQYQTRIFERFYRVDKARSRDLGGTGLGLSIVKNIVDQHGGHIQVKSQLGKGTTFIIELPLQA